MNTPINQPTNQHARQREQMVQWQIERRGVRDPHVLAAMRTVPREAFLAPRLHEAAYDDAPLPIEAGQTISQPYIVALMIQAAQVGPGDRVLEIGAGSGYAAAVMAAIGARVHAIERHRELTDLARERLDGLGYGDIKLQTGDGTCGWPEAAPFDAIVASAGAPQVPDVLCQQLALGGRLVMPVGGRLQQQLLKLIRRDQTRFDRQDLGSVMFVPLIGEHGWTAAQASAPQSWPF